MNRWSRSGWLPGLLLALLAGAGGRAQAPAPVQQLAGYELRIARLSFSDERSLGEDPADLEVRRSLHLSFSIRAPGVGAGPADPERIRGVENVRIEDQNGRDVLAPSLNEVFGPDRPAAPGTSAQERVQQVALEWPYPAPERIRLITGELVLYRTARRASVELGLPRDDAPTQRDLGECQLQIQQVRRRGKKLEVMVRFLYPPGVQPQTATLEPPAVAILEDGTRLPMRALSTSWPVVDGLRTTQQLLTADGVTARPTKLAWNLVVKSDPSRRIPFRFTDYPGTLAPR
jgi:hypothetical protein